MNDTVVYTLRNFRAKTKEAFDKADSDIDVVIERSGTRYILIHESYYQELLNPSDSNIKLPILNKSDIKKVLPDSDPECKRHHTPMSICGWKH